MSGLMTFLLTTRTGMTDLQAYGKEDIMFKRLLAALDSVYMRSSQNGQPNSDAPDVNSGKERRGIFRVARGDTSPAF